MTGQRTVTTTTPWDTSTDVDVQFAAIVSGLTDVEEASKPEHRIVVLVEIPQAGTSAELTYGCRFTVAVGDAVRCPPMPLWPDWQTGIVTRLGDNGYTGPVKYVAPLGGAS